MSDTNMPLYLHHLVTLPLVAWYKKTQKSEQLEVSPWTSKKTLIKQSPNTTVMCVACSNKTVTMEW